MKPLPVDPVTAYARSVVTGKVVAGKLVRLAAKRHLRDLQKSRTKAWGYRYDRATAQRAVDFFPSHLVHVEGKWAGKPVVLEPCEEFIVGSLFGWLIKGTRLRRFRMSYAEVARKFGKSTLAAGIALLLAFFDGEAGAQVYTAATKREQAKIVWGLCSKMVSKSDALRSRIQRFAVNLSSVETGSKLEPLGADLDGLDGLNPNGAIIDELHAHKSRKMVTQIQTAAGARTQPLQFEITTAGWDRMSICWDHHEYAVRVLEEEGFDETWFVYIATIDAGDDWRDPKVWIKANPLLGVSKSVSYMEAECRRAQQLPSEQNDFLRYHLNVWTEQSKRHISMELWDENAAEEKVPTAPGDLIEFAGRECFCGMDLASTSDVAALVMVFPPTRQEQAAAIAEAEAEEREETEEERERREEEEAKPAEPAAPAVKVAPGPWRVLCRFWLPEETVAKRRDKTKYAEWARDGWLRTTPGNVTDYDYIRAEITELTSKLQIREIAYDRWNASQLVTDLVNDGAKMVPFGQGFQSMTPPMRELDRLLLSKRLRHGGNPVLRWMATNLAAKMDPAGNIKPDKEKSADKIDGMVALVMGLGRAIVDPGNHRSIYETRGLIILD